MTLYHAVHSDWSEDIDQFCSNRDLYSRSYFSTLSFL